MIWIYKNRLFESQSFDWGKESLKESGCVQNPDDPELFLVYNKRWDKCFWTYGPQISGNGNQYKLYLLDAYDQSKYYYCEAKNCEIVVPINNLEGKYFDIIICLLKYLRIYDKVRYNTLKGIWTHNNDFPQGNIFLTYSEKSNDYMFKCKINEMINEMKGCKHPTCTISTFLSGCFVWRLTNEGTRFWKRQSIKWAKTINELRLKTF